MKLKVLKLAIISVYLIFLAGSVVRMTGSGMGCPDWPKCFGYYIPPTEEAELLWQPNKSYNKGMIIIVDKALYTAKHNIETAAVYQPQNWAKYTKHDYAVYNVYHTWTEYINRLASVLSGFVFLALLYFVTFKKPKIKGVALCVYLAFVGMLFEAWLGKTVIDSVLTPYVITIHMLAGLIIIALLIKARFLSSQKEINLKYNPWFQKALIISLVMMIGQILLGTQVRQFVDEQVKLFGFEHKQFRLLSPSFKFYFHRSFTIAIVLVNAFLFWINYKYRLGYKAINWVIAFIGFEALTGVLMFYVNFPFGTQAIHLMSGAILFGVLLHLYLTSSYVKKISS